MAQVKDLRTQNLQLQRSHQEPSQAVASTVGISQSYGDRMTQILSTLAKFDAAVQDYRQDSKVVEASVADHLKRLSALAQWSRSLHVTPPLHLGSMRGTTATPHLRNSLRWSYPRGRRLHPFLAYTVGAYGAHGRAIRFIRWWVCPSFLRPPVPRLHLPSERLSGFGVAEGGGRTPRTPPPPRTYIVEGNRRKAEGTCCSRVEGNA